MQVLRFVHCQIKPGLFPHIHSFFHGRYGSRADKASVPLEQREADQIILVGLVQKGHFAVQAVPGHVLVFDRVIVHGVADPSHRGQVVFHVGLRLVHQLFHALCHHGPRAQRKSLVQRKTQEHHKKDRDDGKGDQDGELYSLSARLLHRLSDPFQ